MADINFLVTSGGTEVAGSYNDITEGTGPTNFSGKSYSSSGTLREAINFANNSTADGNTVTVSFAAGVNAVTLGKELPVLTGKLVINGTQSSGTNVTINGGGFRPFSVGDAGTTGMTPGLYSLTLQNLTLTGGKAQGGAGIDGGGGGAGLGGAVLVTSNGALTLDGVSLTGNAATGGTGGSDTQSDSGGGGGLGGAGGPDASSGVCKRWGWISNRQQRSVQCRQRRWHRRGRWR